MKKEKDKDGISNLCSIGILEEDCMKTIFDTLIYSDQDLPETRVSELLTTKYYIPNISEFYEGFEFELLMDCDLGTEIVEHNLQKIEKFSCYTEWVKQTFNLNLQDTVKKALKLNKIRVKILGRDDFESLGYELKRKLYPFYFTNEELGISFKNNFHDEFPNLHIFVNNDATKLFTGRVRNKSELKFILDAIK